MNNGSIRVVAAARRVRQDREMLQELSKQEANALQALIDAGFKQDVNGKWREKGKFVPQVKLDEIRAAHEENINNQIEEIENRIAGCLAKIKRLGGNPKQLGL